jgi:hypothetical protein
MPRPFHAEAIEAIEAIGLNNRGVALLEAGELCGARDAFLRSLENLAKAVLNQGKIENVDHSTWRNDHIQFSWSADCVLVEVEGGEEDDRPATCAFGCYRGVYVNYSPSEFCDPHLNELSAVVVFNTALSTQLLAMNQSESDLLLRSRELYMMSLRLLRRDNDYKQRSLSAGLTFNLVLINNLGQLSYELVDFSEGRKYFDELAMLLLCPFIPRNQNICRTGQLEECDLKGIMLNVMLHAPSTAPCA